MSKLTKYLDSNPHLKPYYLMWLRRTIKTINNWPEKKFIKGVMDCFERHMGYRFDLNNPETFNEKIHWYKIYYHHKDLGRITDKATFKDYIRERLGDGYTIPMYGVWTRIEDFMNDWEILPNEFVLKSNLMANNSGVIVIRDKKNADLKVIKKKVKTWLKIRNTLINSWDCHFYCSTPKVLAEQYMEDEYGELRDYKFYGYDGKVPYFKIDYGRKTGHHANYYNAELKQLDVSPATSKNDDSVRVDLPEKIDEMFKIASELSKGFPFVRVDFYYCKKKVLLSEMTFTPGGGVTHYPIEFDRALGEPFILPR